MERYNQKCRKNDHLGKIYCIKKYNIYNADKVNKEPGKNFWKNKNERGR